MRATAILALLSAAALLAGGCGKSGETSTPAALKIEREDLVAASRALKGIAQPVAGEVAATRAAWPSVAHGLPANTAPLPHPAIAAAAAGAAGVAIPTLLQQARSTSLTGPAAQLAGQFRSSVILATRGWKLTAAAIEQIEHGTPAGARFARANSPLYIESIYDSHSTLAQIGEKLRRAYAKLGGPAAFGSTLTQAEVDALASAYSKGSDLLDPKVGVRLGS